MTQKPPYLFSFWSSPDPAPAYIDLCRETQRANLPETFELVELDFDSCLDWVPERDMLWDFAMPATPGRSFSLAARRMALFTGMLRVALLARHGGLWVDADQVTFPAFARMAPLVNYHDLLAPEDHDGRLSNPVLGACPGSGFAQALWQDLQDQLEAKRQSGEVTARWGEHGFHLLNRTWQNHPPKRPYIAPFGMLITLDAENPPALFDPGAEGPEALSPLALGYSVFNNGIGRAPREMSAQELREGGSLFALVLGHAMGQPGPLDDRLILRDTTQIRGLNRAPVTRKILAQQQRATEDLARLKDKLQDRNTRVSALKKSLQKLRAEPETGDAAAPVPDKGQSG